jgi:TonB family protein
LAVATTLPLILVYIAAVTPIHLFVAVAVLTLPLRAADEQNIAVKSNLVENGLLRVIADLQGRPTELDCQINLSSCSQPPPGAYRMRSATADEGFYSDCTNVVLLKSSSAAKEKIGVYCWANASASDCYMVRCSKVLVETIPAVIPDTALQVGAILFARGQQTTPPKAIHTVDPKYSTNALRGIKNAVVLVTVTVPPDGIPRDVKIAKGVRPDLDKGAVDAVQQWRFEPATQDGKPVEATITVEVWIRSLR